MTPSPTSTTTTLRPAILSKSLPGGSWPVMLTLFREDRAIDFAAMERLTEWYIAQSSSGLFATCQSSEIFQLTFEERMALIRFTQKQAAGRIPVVAGGVIADRLEEGVEQTRRIAGEGVEAVVLLTNQLLAEGEPEEALYARLEHFLNSCPDVTFGLYECPYPYKRLLSAKAVGWCAATGRFSFMKETACHADTLAAKVEAAIGTHLGIYAADNPTLLESLQRGARGYNGVLANVWPRLFSAITGAWKTDYSLAERIQDFVGPASFLILNNYPASAKYLLEKTIGCTSVCRVGYPSLTSAHCAALDQVARAGSALL